MQRYLASKSIMWAKWLTGRDSFINQRFLCRGPFQQNFIFGPAHRSTTNIPVMHRQYQSTFTNLMQPPLPFDPPPTRPPLPPGTPPRSPSPAAHSFSTNTASESSRCWMPVVPNRRKSGRLRSGWKRITVASYNVLAQRLLEEHVDMYDHCHPQWLQWDHRKQRILKEIIHHKPDVLCMQEVQCDHYNDWFKPKLKEIGYDAEYVKRSGDKVDGCAIFYNTSKLTLDHCSAVNYFTAGVPTLNRDNVGLVLLLKATDIESDARLCVANTHLLFNPKRGDVKLAQLQLLFAEIDKIAFRRDLLYKTAAQAASVETKYHPVLLCGDFNALPMSKLYEFVRRGSLEIEGMPQKMVSGQERYPTSFPQLGSALVPESLGISDQCQFVSLFNERERAVQTYHDVDTQEVEQLRRLDDLHLREKHKPAADDVRRKRVRDSSPPSQQKRRSGDERPRRSGDERPRRSSDDRPRHSSPAPEPQASTTSCTCDDANACEASAASSSRADAYGDRHRRTGVHVDLQHSSNDHHPVVIPKEQLNNHQRDKTHRQKVSPSEQASAHARNPVSSRQQQLQQRCSQASGRLSHGFRFDSVYEHAQHVDGVQQKEVTTCHGRAKFTVDYIFYHRGCGKQDESALKLVERYRLHTIEEMAEIGNLPQQQYPSDHIILLGAFNWKESYSD